MLAELETELARLREMLAGGTKLLGVRPPSGKWSVLENPQYLTLALLPLHAGGARGDNCPTARIRWACGPASRVPPHPPPAATHQGDRAAAEAEAGLRRDCARLALGILLSIPSRPFLPFGKVVSAVGSTCYPPPDVTTFFFSIACHQRAGWHADSGVLV